MDFKRFVENGFMDARAGDNGFFAPNGLPSLTMPGLDLPTRTTDTRVRRIEYTTNPITVTFVNGTSWSLTKKQWDYLKTVGKAPKVNSQVRVQTYLDGTVKAVSVTDPDGTPAPLAQQTGKPQTKPIVTRKGPF